MRKRSFQNQNLLYKYYRKFLNLRERISLLMRTGEFYELSRDIRNRMIRRLKLLYDRLVRLAGKQKLKWAGAAVAMILSASVAHAQFNDPVSLSGFLSGYLAKPVFVDLDDDSDLDIVIGNFDGTIHYFENENGVYSSVTNPFNSIDVGNYAMPDMADLDGDDDPDMVVGSGDGTFHYFENDGGTFVEQTGLDNPFNGVDLGNWSDPVFVNFDGDDDIDMASGDRYDGVFYFENEGGVFTQLTGVDNPFDVVAIPMGYNTAPTFADYDDDGDMDLFVGDWYGSITYFRNIEGVFTEQSGANNPFDAISLPYTAHKPVIFDVDDDGDLDLVIGDYFTGVLRYFRNDGGTFTEKRGQPNPFEGIIGIYSAAPAFADMDNDGDMDLLLGQTYGSVKYYENTPEGLELRPDASLFSNVDDLLYYTRPAFGDVDGDGDNDLVIGSGFDTVRYYVREGNNFIDFTHINNPFDTILLGSDPTFVDIDGDNDEDLAIGSLIIAPPDTAGTVTYYQNISDIFLEQTGNNNPFDFVYGEGIDGSVSLTFADLDRDGDLDLFIGEKYGSILFYENDQGTFAKVEGPDNPFNGLNFGYYPVPEFVDIDNDGDLDLFVGSKYNDTGNVYFVENTQGPHINAIEPDITDELINIYSFDHTIVVNAGSNLLKQVDVYSISGSLLTTESINQSGRYELYLPNAAPGIYIVRAVSDGEPVTEKVIIK